MFQFLLSLCGQIRIAMHYSLLVWSLLVDEAIDDLFRMRKRIDGRPGDRSASPAPAPGVDADE